MPGEAQGGHEQKFPHGKGAQELEMPREVWIPIPGVPKEFLELTLYSRDEICLCLWLARRRKSLSGTSQLVFPLNHVSSGMWDAECQLFTRGLWEQQPDRINGNQGSDNFCKCEFRAGDLGT